MQVKTKLMLGGLVAFLGLLAVSVTALFLEKTSMLDDRNSKPGIWWSRPTPCWPTFMSLKSRAL